MSIESTHIAETDIDILNTYKVINDNMSKITRENRDDFNAMVSIVQRFIDNDTIIVGNRPTKLKLLIPENYDGLMKGLHPDKDKTENIINRMEDGDTKYNFIDNGGYSSIKKSKNDQTGEVLITNVKLGHVIRDSNYVSLYSDMIDRLKNLYLNDVKLDIQDIIEFKIIIHKVQDVTLNIKNSLMTTVFPELYGESSYKDGKFKNYVIKLYPHNNYFTINERLLSSEIPIFIPYTRKQCSNNFGPLYTNIYAGGFGNNSINMGNLKELQNQEVIARIIEINNM